MCTGRHVFVRIVPGTKSGDAHTVHVFVSKLTCQMGLCEDCFEVVHERDCRFEV